MSEPVAAARATQDEQRETTHLLAHIDSRWRATGVARRERLQLLAEVRTDLTAMQEESGITDPRELLGTDPDTFADDVIAARGLRKPAGCYGRLLTWAAIGTAVAVPTLFTLLMSILSGMANAGGVEEPRPLVPGYEQPAVIIEPSTTGDTVVAVGLYALMGMLFIAVVLTAVGYGLRRDTRVKGTVGRMAVLMPLSAGLSVPAAVYFAGVSGYSTTLPIVAFEVFLVLALAALAIVGARFWALRR